MMRFSVLLCAVSFCLLALCSTDAEAQMAVDNKASCGFQHSSNSQTCSYTVNSNTNGLLTACFSFAATSPGGNGTVTGITYNGVALTKAIDESDSTFGTIYSSLWYLKAPSTGTHNLVVSYSGTPSIDSGGGIVSFTGVDQTTPISNAASSSGQGDPVSITVSSRPGNTILDCAYAATNPGVLLTSGQTLQWRDTDSSIGSVSDGQQTAAGGNSPLNMSWTGTSSGNIWNALGINIHRVPPAPGTYTAASCNRDDVDSVINGPIHAVVNGDVINIPAGTCEWYNTITIPTEIGISIIGAGTTDAHNPSGDGTHTTTIIDCATTSSPCSGTGGYLFTFTPTYGASLSRLSSMTITRDAGLSLHTLGAVVGVEGTCTSSGCPNIRLDHLVFPASPSWGGMTSPSSTLFVTDNVFGVLDHNSAYLDDPVTYYEFLNFNHSAWQGVGQYGDNSWAQPNTFGTNQSLYVETNYFELKQGTLFPITEAEGGVSGQTTEGGGRVVCRFNTFIGLISACVNHGTESNGRPRGGRQMEFYKNSMNCPSSTYPACWNNQVNFGPGPRSGSLIDVANSYTTNGHGPDNFVRLTQYRALQVTSNYDSTPPPFGSPWIACDGKGPYDSNADTTVYASGTITSLSQTSGLAWTVTDNTKSWTTNQWVNAASYPYSIHDVNTGDGSMIQSNGTTTLSGVPWSGNNNFTVGDAYEIRRAVSCIDQSGYIGGSLLSGDTPSPTNASGGWVNQTLDPIYQAADTSDGAGLPPGGAVGSGMALRFLANHDYYAQVSLSAQTSPTSPFNGTVGTGYGTLANMPSTCTVEVGYWATDVGGDWDKSNASVNDGSLYRCSATNTWTLAYTPFPYPHFLTTITEEVPGAPSPSTQLIVLASIAMMLMWGSHILGTPLVKHASRNNQCPNIHSNVPSNVLDIGGHSQR